MALSGCESSGSREGFSSFLRGIRLEGSWQHIELPYPYFTNRGGEREKGGGRKGGGSASHKSADVRGKEGKKKRGKRKRNEREREKGSFAVLLPRVLLRPGRDIGERCQ